MIGQKLGRYEILAKLGAGAMGDVYRARDLRLGREVALKVLPERVREEPDRLRRFDQEARAASALNHPNIVTVHDVGQADGVPYIAMELVEGHTLKTLLGMAPLPLKKTLALAAQAAEGLAKAHAAGIVHRDLKPENLIVSRDGYLKILDFGLAKLHDPLPAAPEGPTDAVTRPGVLLGTVGYMSPEQARGQAVDFRSDQFAIGAILYEMATGRRAFQKATAAQTLAAIIESEPEPIQSLNPEVPPPLRWIVERCLQKNPDDRYASTLDFARELRNVHDRLDEVTGLSGSGAGALQRPPPPRHARMRPVAALVAAGVTLVALAGLGLRLWPPAAAGRPPAVAVLPIRNLGLPEDDYLGVAIADAVMMRLAEIPSLSVVDRSALREQRTAGDDIAKAARDLGAGYLVTGTVRRVERRLNVAIKLVAADSTLTWGEQYDAAQEDILGLQSRIAQGLSDALQVRLSAGDRLRLERPPTQNAAAYADYSQARAFLERPDVPENVDRAIAIFERAIAKDPAFAVAHAGLGEAFWEKYQATQDNVWATRAQAAILEGLRLDPAQPQVRIALALVHEGTGQIDAAIEELRRAIALRPDSDAAHRQLGLMLEAKGRKEEALRELQAAVSLRPAYWRNHSHLGNLYFRTGRYPQALAAFERVIELQPDNPRGFQMLGTTHQAMGRNDEALSNYARANAIRPDSRAYTNIGKIHYDAGRYEAAAAAFEEAARLEPAPVKFRNLGDAYHRLRSAEKARAAWSTAVELASRMLDVNPKDARLLALRALCEAKLGRTEKAERAAAAAVALSPKDAEVLYRKAVVSALASKLDAASKELSEALAQGYSASQAATDEDLAPLRDRPEWAALKNDRKGAR